jgi:threonine/homoserine/homoserine lactone efflux protein
MFEGLAAYLLVTTLLVLTPGASTAVVVRNVISGGRSAGMAAALGALTGNTTYALAAGLGLPALLTRVPAALTLLRVTGAGYMAWLGIRSLWAIRRRPPLEMSVGETHASTRAAGFRQGLVTNLLNPAVATFYFILVPTFLPADSSLAAARFALFAAIHVSMAFAYHVSWAWGFHALRRVWSRPAARRAVESLTGIALLVLAWKILIGA